MGRLALVLGGARSGKSSFAIKMARDIGGDVIYLATAIVTDKEMAERIARHRAERPANWQTIEEPYSLEKIVDILQRATTTVLLDCLTLLLSNIILKERVEELYRMEEKIIGRFSYLADAVIKGNCHAIFVANEVGMGICPENYLGRVFRDLAGRINQEVAQKSHEVYFLCAGIPRKIKYLEGERDG